MAEEFELITSTVRGVVHLFVGKIFSRAIGAIGGLLLIRLLGPTDYGLLYVAVVAPGFFALFSDLGVNAAMTKHLAEYKATRKVNVKSMLYTGLIFQVTLGLGLTILCFVFADAFAVLIGKPYVSSLTQVASLSILAWSLYRLSEAVLLGLDATRAYASLMLFMEFLQAWLPILLVVLGMGVFGAISGQVVATLIAGLGGILVGLSLARACGSSGEILGFRENLKKIIRYGGPLSAATFIMEAAGRFYSFMIATYVVAYEIGNYNAAQGVVALIAYLTFPVLTVLFPAFSKINQKKNPAMLEKLFNYSVKYSSLFVLPAVVLIIALAHPLTVFLFGVEFEDAYVFLMLLAVNELRFALGGTHIRRLLMGQGETGFIAKLETLSALIGVGLGLILIPAYGVLGYILIIYSARWPSYFLSLRKIRKSYGVTPPFHSILRLYVSLAMMAVFIVPVALAPLNEVLKLVIGGTITLVAFAASTVLTRAIKEEDIDFLMNILKTQPFIGRIAEKALEILKRISKWRA